MAEKSKKQKPTQEELAEEGYTAVNTDNVVTLKTHELLSSVYAGELNHLEEGRAVVSLHTLDDMSVDKMGLVHGGFIFSAADFAAMAAVNEKNVVLAASKSEFLSPVKVGDIVEFTAQVKQKEGRKRIVQVEGKLGNVKIFAGDFKTVITERHVLKLDLVDSVEA